MSQDWQNIWMTSVPVRMLNVARKSSLEATGNLQKENAFRIVRLLLELLDLFVQD